VNGLRLQTLSHYPAQFSAIIVRAGSKTDVQGQTTIGSLSLHFANGVTSNPTVMNTNRISGVQTHLDSHGNSGNEQNKAMHDSMV
jgi:hypothetical protein